MTRTPKTARLEEVASTDLVDKVEFRREAVWLPAMTVQHWNAGRMAIEGKTFTDCVIEGPAVMAVMNGTVFEDCTMGATSDMRTLLYRSLSPEKMAGVVGMANCRFVRCRFVQVGFTGGEELLDELQTKVRQAPAGDAAQ